MPGAGDCRLTDYREHYTRDAEAIVDPADLPARHQAAESRRLHALVRLLAPKPDETILDAGCGSGWFAVACHRTGATVRAMDIAPGGVAGARQRYGQHAGFLAGDVYRLPFLSQSFDAIVLSEVVEHLEDVAAALREAHRVLRPGGRVLVSVPYRERITYHLCIHCNRLTPANAHLHSFDLSRLEALLRSGGLQPQRSMLLTSKVLERLGFAYRTRRWPYWVWRTVDRLCNRLVPGAAYLCVLASRTD